MNDQKIFELLRLLVNGIYVSKVFTFVNIVDDVMCFRCKNAGELYYINSAECKMIHEDKEQDIQTVQFSLVGFIQSSKFAHELLSSSSYFGCQLTTYKDKYYFKRAGKIYMVCIIIFGTIQSMDDDDCSFEEICAKFRTGPTTRHKFEDFVNLILHTTNVKSARS